MSKLSLRFAYDEVIALQKNYFISIITFLQNDSTEYFFMCFCREQQNQMYSKYTPCV